VKECLQRKAKDLRAVDALIKKACDPVLYASWHDEMTAQRGEIDRGRSLAHDNVMIKAKQGNSQYTLSRLRPERSDLFARVVAKELSANAAAKKVGDQKAVECGRAVQRFNW
jgi:hypothetical protein